MKARVLLVEDDPAVLKVLHATIEHGGFEGEQASSAFDALNRLREEPFDSVLLDLGLPDAEGGHLIREIRKTSDVPIIVVSGDHSERSKIAALDAGADDFVQKPFLPGELLARIRAALRRRPPVGDGTQSVPEFQAQAWRNSCTLHFTLKEASKEKKLLDYLQNHGLALATNDDIIAAIWGESGKRNEKNVRVLVAMLRRKLKAQNTDLDIVNEHGRGYRLRRLSEH